MLWTECLHSPKFICRNPNHPCNILGRGAFGRSLGHEGGSLVSGISALVRRDRRACSDLPLSMWGYIKKVAVWHRGSVFSPDTRPASALIIDFSASRTVRSKFSCLSHPVYDIFVIAAWTDEDTLSSPTVEVLLLASPSAWGPDFNKILMTWKNGYAVQSGDQISS